ncbi:MAG: hypothetical protein Q8P17_01015 [bacterium]|nr:hypothetical protein [bacterium]
MKLILLGFVLWFALTLPSSAESAEGVYQLVSLKERHAKISDIHWKACGEYFAAAESTEGKVVHFNFKKKSAGKLSVVFAFSKIEDVVVLTKKGTTIPTVAIMGTKRRMQFAISLTAEDYKASLPCLANGVGI